MANVKPNTIFPGLSCNGTSVMIPLSALPGLTAENANGETGNAAELLRIVIESAFQSLSKLQDSQQPKNMTWTKEFPKGQGMDRVEQSYTWNFELKLNQTSLEMADER